MRLILFLILFNSLSVFSQIVRFKPDTLFIDGLELSIEEDNIYYELNLFDSTLVTNSSYEVIRKISYDIKDGVITLSNDIKIEILNDRIKLVHLNDKGEDDFYFVGNYKVSYESKR
jgi:hypothetical protein